MLVAHEEGLLRRLDKPVHVVEALGLGACEPLEDAEDHQRGEALGRRRHAEHPALPQPHLQGTQDERALALEVGEPQRTARRLELARHLTREVAAVEVVEPRAGETIESTGERGVAEEAAELGLRGARHVDLGEARHVLELRAFGNVGLHLRARRGKAVPRVVRGVLQEPRERQAPAPRGRARVPPASPRRRRRRQGLRARRAPGSTRRARAPGRTRRWRAPRPRRTRRCRRALRRSWRRARSCRRRGCSYADRRRRWSPPPPSPRARCHPRAAPRAPPRPQGDAAPRPCRASPAPSRSSPFLNCPRRIAAAHKAGARTWSSALTRRSVAAADLVGQPRRDGGGERLGARPLGQAFRHDPRAVGLGAHGARQESAPRTRRQVSSRTASRISRRSWRRRRRSIGWMAVTRPSSGIPRNTQPSALRHAPARPPSATPGPNALARVSAVAGLAAPVLT